MEESKIQLHVDKMTCVNCQKKIEKKLKGTKGIVSASVSYNKGTADIVYDGRKISRKEIIAIIEDLGYEVLPEKAKQETDMGRILCMLFIIVSLYILLQSRGILNLLVPSRLADTKMGYGMLFVIGLLTSVHCVAMCGGINLSQCIPRAGQKPAENSGKLAAFRPAFFYNMGRVLSYTAVGFVLGLIGFIIGGGTEIGISTILQGALKMIAGLLMVIMGINMLGIFPWLRRFTIRMPGTLKFKSSRPFLVGILNGFMPCGPLQSMWIVALAAGNPFAGALSMFLFALGTVPLMLGLGSFVSALGKKFADKVMTVGAVLVVVLGLAMLSQGGSLSGWLSPDLLLVLVIACCIAGAILSIPVDKKVWKNMRKAVSAAIILGSFVLWNAAETRGQKNPESGETAEIADGVQVVNSTLEARRFPNITVQAGVPVKWIIDAPQGSINGCNYKILIPDYDIEYTFRTGENVIEFTPTDTGMVRYSCWMGMIYGNIFVTDGTESSEKESGGDVSVPTPSGYEIPTDTIAVASRTEDNGYEVQEINVQLTDEGFSPAIVVVQKDMAVIWNIDNEMTDAKNGIPLLAPYYSTQLYLGEGANQLSLYPTESFDVSTGDNRFYCYVKVVDDLNEVDEEAVREEAASFETMIYPAEIFESSGGSCCN